MAPNRSWRWRSSEHLVQLLVRCPVALPQLGVHEDERRAPGGRHPRGDVREAPERTLGRHVPVDGRLAGEVGEARLEHDLHARAAGDEDRPGLAAAVEEALVLADGRAEDAGEGPGERDQTPQLEQAGIEGVVLEGRGHLPGARDRRSGQRRADPGRELGIPLRPGDVSRGDTGLDALEQCGYGAPAQDPFGGLAGISDVRDAKESQERRAQGPCLATLRAVRRRTRRGGRRLELVQRPPNGVGGQHVLRGGVVALDHHDRVGPGSREAPPRPDVAGDVEPAPDLAGDLVPDTLVPKVGGRAEPTSYVGEPGGRRQGNPQPQRRGHRPRVGLPSRAGEVGWLRVGGGPLREPGALAAGEVGDDLVHRGRDRRRP